jgi:hypothetical protein
MINQLIECLRKYFFYHPDPKKDEEAGTYYDGIYNEAYYDSYLQY